MGGAAARPPEPTDLETLLMVSIAVLKRTQAMIERQDAGTGPDGLRRALTYAASRCAALEAAITAAGMQVAFAPQPLPVPPRPRRHAQGGRPPFLRRVV